MEQQSARHRVTLACTIIFLPISAWALRRQSAILATI
jgi:hypothetical protein